ncbi:Beta-galactosidase [Thalassoglobus neptunius]|uniref:Beta-galactosidase n=1 Tax=Thalassoglobus neptunius TaxID=1938619 RepID=A0A5C5WLE4_9PLAN|nr:sugar-binding domain-containing protein [Thalassoglobus neptunius]TWT51498.1 Beta-galactosidase [Thalassoglobus neptunius]
MNRRRTHFESLLIAITLSVICLPNIGFGETLELAKWKYNFRKPRNRWMQPNFDDSRWMDGFGGFGTRETPGQRVSTSWNTNDIWMRRSFTLSEIPARPALLIHHDEDAEIFINGKRVAALKGYITEYQVIELDDAAKKTLKVGKNVLAVHCHQTGGGQYIDVHVIDADNIPDLPEPVRETKPFQTELITEWGAEVTPENAWTEYPRPALVRDEWKNLNGNWNYAITPRSQNTVPEKWDGEILVPFPLESKLSGVQRLLAPDEALWYQRPISVEKTNDVRTLLNFEAVDYHCEVWLNGTSVGHHTGGNVPFSIDVTDAVKAGENVLTVRVEDATEEWQLRGKQVLNPRGIWYTQVSGIWQTVWLEQVPEAYIADLKIRTDAQTGTVSLKPVIEVGAGEDHQIEVIVRDGGNEVLRQSGTGDKVEVTILDVKLWSPSSPHLYDLTVNLKSKDGTLLDSVESYTGVRTVGKTRDADGHWRLTLNGEVIFHWGTLDQGWWPDGLLTPPSDEAMLFDIEYLRDAGFNMIRKHIKVEPRRYYTYCDQMGMLVWQDQVSGGQNPPWTRLEPEPTDAEWPEEQHEQFMTEFEEMVSTLESHPSIVVWTPFNEAWGQHRTVEVGKWIAERDPTRTINIASGGNFWPVGDIVDAHSYPHPRFPFEPDRDAEFVMVMGEFGGHGYPIRDHLWDASRRNWGYGGLPENKEEYRARYLESIRLLAELKEQGIAAGVYTQTTDVEGEINGLITYDRKVIKIPAEELRKIHEALFEDASEE